MSSIYPKAVLEHLRSSQNIRDIERSNGCGKSVALECGTFVGFEISIEPETKQIKEIAFSSNGCGYMVAAADLLASEFRGRHLTELHALTEEPRALIFERLGSFPQERQHCAATVVIALKEAFADFRRRRVEEFNGEEALICTCFGVTEEAIESTVRQTSADTVDQVGQICKAGTGCGSCQMMIQEIIDSTNCREETGKGLML